MSSIVERVKKLIQLSKQNDSPMEAANAAALAQDLMFKYQIGEADLDTTSEEQRGVEEIITDGIRTGERRRTVWKSNLAHAVADGFGCEMYFTSEWVTINGHAQWESTFKIFGTKPAVQTVHYVYGYLVLEITRLAEEGWIRHGKEQRQNAKTWKNSFRLGAVNEIRRRLNAQRREQKIQVAEAAKEAPVEKNTALALYQTDEQRVADEWKSESKRLRLRTVSDGRRNYNPNAYERGKNAGRSIGLGSGKAGIEGSKGRIE